ncbi:MAG: DegT/DnrJ/EryC1/StrS family aminotransferase [Acidobacteria bacterium]|nr:DegT/DnrJ/EryC1/StrS family aminotransferase [Acidobacteriota bacterium]
MKVPLLDLRAQYAPIREDVLTAVTRVCDSQHFVLGPEVEALESAMAALVGATAAVGVSSGTDALLAALMALGVGPGDEVIVPAFSFFATAGSVARLGATPVFVDVEVDTLTLDPEAVRRAVTPRTRAIMPVHLYGLCADMDALGEVARTAGVPLVEDAAQAIGATCGGRAAGALGLLACFSFFPTKNLGGFGDGGLVTTSDPALAARVRLLRNHGAEQRYHHRVVGGNFRLDALQAAVLAVKLPHLAGWNAARRAHAHQYARLFADAGLVGTLALPPEPAGRLHVYHQYVVRVPRRDHVRAHLAERGVSTEVYYPVPLNRQECFATVTRDRPGCPVAERAAGDVLALPVHPGLAEAQLRHVVACVAEALS